MGDGGCCGESAPGTGCCGESAGAPGACGRPAAGAAPGPGTAAASLRFDGMVAAAVGEVPRVPTSLELRDRLGAWKARWGIGRMNYRIEPGLYAVGTPGAASPVLVSANYKMSFDALRSSLTGSDAWLLVLDTGGINVWCAAGKGTFGTDELVRRVASSGLARLVSHRILVVPQLGAPGVSAHAVRERSGFRVVYGPVQAKDLPAFLDAGSKAEPAMRRVPFGWRERVVLIPVELVSSWKKALLLAVPFLVLGGLGAHGYSLTGVRTVGLAGLSFVLGSFLAGAVLGPLLLPLLPGRAFSVKGAALGLALVAAVAALGGPGPGWFGSWLHLAAWGLIAPAVSSFVVLNFTGATTFTSLSGVLQEMRIAIPLQLAASVVGLGLWITGLFVPGGLAP